VCVHVCVCVCMCVKGVFMQYASIIDPSTKFACGSNMQALKG